MQKQSRLSKFSCFEFFRLKGGGDNFAYVRRGRRVNEKRTGAYKGEGGPKLAILLRTYFMDAPLKD